LQKNKKGRINNYMAIPSTGSYVFSNIVANPNATNPISLNLTLNNNGVSANAGNLGSVKAILFNAVDPLAGTQTEKEFIIDGVTTKVLIDANYDNTNFGLLLSNGTSFIVTLDDATTQQTQSAFNGFDTVSPEKLRKWGLEVGGF